MVNADAEHPSSHLPLSGRGQTTGCLWFEDCRSERFARFATGRGRSGCVRLEIDRRSRLIVNGGSSGGM